MGTRLGRTDLLVLCVMATWASSFSIVKYGLREMGPLSYATVRFVTATILLLGWVCIAEGRPVIARKDWWRVAVVGLTTIGAYQALFTMGLLHTTATNSSLMLASIPAWTAVLAVASRQESISVTQIVGILMSFTGVGLAIRGGGADFALNWESVQGDVLTLVAAALYAWGMVVAKPLLAKYSSLRMMSWATFCGTLLLLLVSGPQLAAQDWSRVSLATWLGLAFIAVFGSVFAFVIWFKSVGEIGASRTAIYNNLIPPMAILIAFATLGESLTLLQALGAAVVIFGVTLTRFGHAKAATTAQG
jgi:drug/metabolite transporter (DMT)-like permease